MCSGHETQARRPKVCPIEHKIVARYRIPSPLVKRPKSGTGNPCRALMCVMSIIFCNVTLCGPVSHQRFGGTYCFHRYGWRQIQASNQQEIRSKQIWMQAVRFSDKWWATSGLQGVTAATTSRLARLWCFASCSHLTFSSSSIEQQVNKMQCSFYSIPTVNSLGIPKWSCQLPIILPSVRSWQLRNKIISSLNFYWEMQRKYQITKPDEGRPRAGG
jgi:hypothetical protein